MKIGSKFEPYFHRNHERNEAICKLCDRIMHIDSVRMHLKRKHSIVPQEIKYYKCEGSKEEPVVDPLQANVNEKSGETTSDASQRQTETSTCKERKRNNSDGCAIPPESSNGKKRKRYHSEGENVEVSDGVLSHTTTLQHSESTGQLLAQLWNDHLSKDMSVVASGGHVIRCHSAVFSLISPFVKSLLEESQEEFCVHLPDFDRSVVEHFLKLAYSSSHDSDTLDIRDILSILQVKETIERDKDFPTNERSKRVPGFVSIVRRVSDFGTSHSLRRENILKSKDQQVLALQTEKLCPKDADTNIYRLENERFADSLWEKREKQEEKREIKRKSKKRILRIAEKEAIVQSILSQRSHKKGSKWDQINEYINPTYGSNLTQKGGDLCYFECPKCSAKTNSKSHLQLHLQVAHNHQWECDQCLSTFCTERELSAHKALSHAGDQDRDKTNQSTVNRIACPNCRVSCTSDKELHAHLKWVHDQYWDCNECSSTYQEELELRAHKALTHGLDEEEGAFNVQDTIGNGIGQKMGGNPARKIISPKDTDDLWVNCCLCQKSMKTSLKTTDSIISGLNANRKVKIQYKCNACNEKSSLSPAETIMIE